MFKRSRLVTTLFVAVLIGLLILIPLGCTENAADGTGTENISENPSITDLQNENEDEREKENEGENESKGEGDEDEEAQALSSLSSSPSPLAASAETIFTIVQVPDTQQEVLTANNPLMASRYQWIADNAAPKNIKFVAHVGDVVNWGHVDPAQFTRADTATRILDNAGIPYALATGNHDTAAVTTGGSAAAGNVRNNLRNTSAFNRTFPLSRFRNVGGVFEAGKVDNMYQTFTAGGKQWLVLTLEMWPRTSAITWAQGILASHPHHNVIINTHANIDAGGARPSAGVYGDNNPQILWEQLGSRYFNVRMILSGHFGGSPAAGYNTVTGVNGNKVLQVFTAYTSLYQNHLRTLKIDTAAGTVTSEVFVPLSTNPARYPSGKITDKASDFTISGMAFVNPPAAAAAEQQPGASNTGVPAGKKLTVHEGDLKITKDNTVIDSMEIRGLVRVEAKNVVIKNCLITGRYLSSPLSLIYVNGLNYSLTVQDSELYSKNPSPYVNGIIGQNFTLARVNIHHVVDQVTVIGNNVVVKDSWLHDNLYYAKDPNHNGTPSHDDNIQIQQGNHIQLLRNTMTSSHNAAVMVTQDTGVVSNVLIEGNYVSHGACSFNLAQKSYGPLKGFVIKNNTFTRTQTYAGCVIIVDAASVPYLSLARNLWTDNKPISVLSR